jgi:hypothetical protein
MSSKNNKSLKPGEHTLRKIEISRYRSELDELKRQGEEQYKPKIGRQIKEVKKILSRIDPASKTEAAPAKVISKKSANVSKVKKQKKSSSHSSEE